MSDAFDIESAMQRDIGKKPYRGAHQDDVDRYNMLAEEWLIIVGQNLPGAIQYINKIRNHETIH